MAAPGLESDGAGANSVGDSPELSTAAITNLKDLETKGVPLNTPWTFWINHAIHGLTAAEYEASVKKIYTVSTVQSFWSVYNHIPKVEELKVYCNYHMMRESRPPIWENEYHRKGGMWRLKCHKLDTSKVWSETLLAAIGEQFQESMAPGDEVCGVSVNIRERDDIVQIWNTNAQQSNSSLVLQKIHELLPQVVFHAEFYQVHDSSYRPLGVRRTQPRN